MTISTDAKVDLLYKKAFGVTKTDLPGNKSPSNEAIASPALLRGDNVWQQANDIPGIAAGVDGIVQAYTGANAIQCTADNTSVPISSVYPSWKTNLTDWIPSEFGATYFIKLYVDSSGVADATATGTQIFDSGSSGSGEWNFDYQAGVLNFIGGTIPATLISSKVLYIVGYRYIGSRGVTSFPNGLTIGNINISGNTISNSANAITFTSNIVAGNATITSSLIVNNTDVYSNLSSTAENVNTLFGNASVQSTWLANLDASVVALQANVYSNANVTSFLTTYSGNISAENVFADIHGNVYADYIFSNTGNTVVISSTGALQVPVGTTLDRPVGNNGYIRFNSDIPSIEYFDGSIWVPITNTITDQQITPDGVSLTYTLDQEATDISIIVSINGVLQRPTYAYTVVGDQITFNDAPLDSDIIDIRFLGSSVTINSSLSDDLVVAGNLTVNGNINNANFTYTYGNTQVAAYLLANPQGSTYSNANVKSYLTQIDGNIIPSANVTYSLGDSTHQWKDLWVSNNTIYIGNTPITVSNGTLLINNSPVTGGSTYSNTNVAAYLTTDATVTTLQANLGVTQTWANANIASINANIGGFYSWANTNFGTSSYSNTNANALLSSNTISTINTTGNIKTIANVIGTTFMFANGVNILSTVGSTYSNTNVAAYLTTDSTVTALQANLGVTQIWANANIASINANLGSYYAWANANVAGLQTSITSLRTNANANTAAYLAAGISTNVTTTGNISAGNVLINGALTSFGTVNPAFIVVGITSSVTSFGAGSTFILDTVVGNVNSQTSYNTSTGVFTLTAGVTYDMSFTPSFITFSNTTGGYLCYQWVDASTNTPLDSTGTGIGTSIPTTESGGQNDNPTARVIYTPSTNQTVKLYVTSANGTATLRGGIGTQAVVQPLNRPFALQSNITFANVTATNTANVGNLITTSGIYWANGTAWSSTTGTTYSNTNVAAYLTTATISTTGNITTSGNFVGNGAALTGVALKTTGSWTVTTGTNTYSFTVPASGTYQLWVDCNIPNGILVWNATATVTNTNVPVVGAQYAWVYNGGGSPIDFTSIPNQFVGTGNTIVRSSVSPSATTNRFDFGINNTSGGNVTVRYGWVAIS